MTDLDLRVDEDGRERDVMGDIVPHKLSFLHFIKAVAGLAGQFKEIPAEVWNADEYEDGRRLAIVSCPCGEAPEVEFNSVEECACHRFFAFTGRKVLAANRPGQYAEQPVAVDDSDDD